MKKEDTNLQTNHCSLNAAGQGACGNPITSTCSIYAFCTCNYNTWCMDEKKNECAAHAHIRTYMHTAIYLKKLPAILSNMTKYACIYLQCEDLHSFLWSGYWSWHMQKVPRTSVQMMVWGSAPKHLQSHACNAHEGMHWQPTCRQIYLYIAANCHAANVTVCLVYRWLNCLPVQQRLKAVSRFNCIFSQWDWVNSCKASELRRVHGGNTIEFLCNSKLGVP